MYITCGAHHIHHILATSQNSFNSHLISSDLSHYFSISSFSAKIFKMFKSYASAQRTSHQQTSNYYRCLRCGVTGHSPFHCIFFTQKIICEYFHIIGHHSSVCFRRSHRGLSNLSHSSRNSSISHQGNYHFLNSPHSQNGESQYSQNYSKSHQNFDHPSSNWCTSVLELDNFSSILTVTSDQEDYPTLSCTAIVNGNPINMEMDKGSSDSFLNSN